MLIWYKPPPKPLRGCDIFRTHLKKYKINNPYECRKDGIFMRVFVLTEIHRPLPSTETVSSIKEYS